MERLCLALCHPLLIKKSRLWPTHCSVSLIAASISIEECFSSRPSSSVVDTLMIISSLSFSVYRVDSETASMNSRSHPRNTSTSCVQASQKRSCSTAWSRSECLSPATLSGKSFQLLSHFTNCCPSVGISLVIHKE